jgi:hypothetical protein
LTERVVSLSDRGRALEWLSLGFGLWLIGGLVFAVLALDATTSGIGRDGYVAVNESLGLVSCGVHLIAGIAIATGGAFLIRSGSWFWSSWAIAALLVAVVERTVITVGMSIQGHDSPWHPAFAWSTEAFAELILVTAIAQGVRSVASREGRALPASLIGVVAFASLTRYLLIFTFPVETETLSRAPMQPWTYAALIAIATLVSIGILLLVIREASDVVREQIWAGEPGVTSPARSADWQRSASGLAGFGAFLIGKIALGAAAVPLAVVAVLTGTPDIPLVLLPAGGAIASAGMALGLFACRRIPDPPDARSGFTGAALLLAVSMLADLYLASGGHATPLTSTVASLAHLVAYLAVLRSLARIGERLGHDSVVTRARLLGWLVVGAVGGATIIGYLLNPGLEESVAAAIAVPALVAAVAFAVLLPCALVCREVARTLRGRFAAPPPARAVSAGRRARSRS